MADLIEEVSKTRREVDLKQVYMHATNSGLNMIITVTMMRDFMC